MSDIYCILLFIIGCVGGWLGRRWYYRSVVMGLVRVLATASRDMHLLAMCPDNTRADVDKNVAGVLMSVAHVLEHST